MEQRIRRKEKLRRRFWGFLGCLWLVMACLTGCAVSGDNGAGGQRTAQASEESGTGRGQESTAEARDDEEGGTAKEEPETGQEFLGEKGSSAENGTSAAAVEESGVYTSKDEVALYLHLYGRLPDNYITKKEAEELGWNSREGNLWEVAPGMSIGGSRFGNYEGALPDKKGRRYFECDIDYEGGYRGAKRLIYSDDGLIFYTEDHYNTFEQLYGE